MAGTAFGPMQGRCLPHNYNLYIYTRNILDFAGKTFLQAAFVLTEVD